MRQIRRHDHRCTALRQRQTSTLEDRRLMLPFGLSGYENVLERGLDDLPIIGKFTHHLLALHKLRCENSRLMQ
jgi:hypothetical protein